MKYQLLILTALLIGLSCKEELEPTPYTYPQIFTGENSKTWKVVYIDFTENGEVVDRIAQSCFTDDRFTFYANPERLYTANTGSIICGDESEIVASWGFTNATATLTIVIPFLSNATLPFFIRDVDDDDLELEIFLDEAGTESYRIFFEMTDED